MISKRFRRNAIGGIAALPLLVGTIAVTATPANAIDREWCGSWFNQEVASVKACVTYTSGSSLVGHVVRVYNPYRSATTYTVYAKRVRNGTQHSCLSARRITVPGEGTGYLRCTSAHAPGNTYRTWPAWVVDHADNAAYSPTVRL